ncbi:MAG: type II secretion system protein M [Planctomycetes bacterium]|nr:type II secretion system protein M [Planctomycetota bacterium]
MIVSRKPLILGIDLLGLAVVLGLLTLVIVGIIIPLQRDALALPSVRRQVQATQDRYDQLARENPAVARQLKEQEEMLRTRASQPLADIGNFLERLSAECSRSGVNLLEIQPLATESDGAHRSWNVHVRAEGKFPDFQRLLQRIESSSPYVQVRDLAVQGMPQANVSTCQLTWTLRVNYLPSGPTAGSG